MPMELTPKSIPVDGQTPEAGYFPAPPIHMAIERTTVALIELQRIRHRIDSGVAIPNAGDLQALERTLLELGTVLQSIRDGG
jgi:hypothetical protein